MLMLCNGCRISKEASAPEQALHSEQHLCAVAAGVCLLLLLGLTYRACIDTRRWILQDGSCTTLHRQCMYAAVLSCKDLCGERDAGVAGDGCCEKSCTRTADGNRQDRAICIVIHL
jgi:hypothetical protein